MPKVTAMSATTAATAAMPPMTAKSPDTNAAILPADCTLVYNVYVVLPTVMSPEMTMITVAALVFVSLESVSKDLLRPSNSALIASPRTAFNRSYLAVATEKPSARWAGGYYQLQW